MSEPIREHLIHTWDISDEYGWRKIELWLIGDDLELYALDKDGNEIPHYLY